jgi:hypothetical protein
MWTRPAAPYVEEYARRNDINIDRLGRLLFPNGYPQPERNDRAGVLISSYQHIDHHNGSWTYISSNRLVLYQLMKVAFLDRPEPLLLVLFARQTPERIIIDRFVAEWLIAIVDERYRVLSETRFKTQIQHRIIGLWDMIYTDLALDEKGVIVRILYTHSGGGGGRDQEFTFRFQATISPLRLRLLSAEQTLDEY